jgi:carboxylesterase
MVFKVVVVLKSMRVDDKAKKIWYVVLAVVFFVFIVVYLKTGFLQLDKIDERDLEKWNHNKNEIIVGAEEFNVEGGREVCWLMIHGYSSTPNDFRVLAGRVSEEFGDYIVVPRLEGHGEVPSKVLDLSLDDWYTQIEREFNKLNIECDGVNLVGFSLGGALASRLAEEKDVGRIYLISPFIFVGNKFLVFSVDRFLKKFSEVFLYSKKINVGQINDVEGGGDYIAYYNFPLVPIKNSYDFIDIVVRDLARIEEPILIQHSKEDDAANFESSEIIFKNIGSEDKEFKEFDRSNHVLLFDYDREEIINNVIEFEGERR